MDKYVKSSGNVTIHYEISGTGPVALLFVHGWLGSSDWWHNQKHHFLNKYTVLCMDLAGHGKSDTRTSYSSTQYAEDVRAVAGDIDHMVIILVGHSMSGPYVLEAAPFIPNAKAIILVDTFKDPDQTLTHEKADELIFTHYRKDFRSAIEKILPQFLYAKETPAAVIEQLKNDFLKYDGKTAIMLIEPLYLIDTKKIASMVKTPVRAINSDLSPTNRDSLLKFIDDYDFLTIHGSGHYPMLEKPAEFNKALENLIEKLHLG